MDSGAVVSVIHEQMLEYCDYEPTGTRTKEYLGAGGHTLSLLPYVVDVSVEVKGVGMVVFRKVLVLKKDSKVTRTLLIGRSDLARLRATIDFAKNEVRMGTEKHRKTIKMREKHSKVIRKVSGSQKSHEERMRRIEKKMDRIFEGFDINMVKARPRKRESSRKRRSNDKNEWARSPEDPQGVQEAHKIEDDAMSTEAVCGEPCMYTDPNGCCKGCEKCVDESVRKWLKANEKAPDIEGKEGREVGVCLSNTSNG